MNNQASSPNQALHTLGLNIIVDGRNEVHLGEQIARVVVARFDFPFGVEGAQRVGENHQ